MAGEVCYFIIRPSEERVRNRGFRTLHGSPVQLAQEPGYTHYNVWTDIAADIGKYSLS